MHTYRQTHSQILFVAEFYQETTCVLHSAWYSTNTTDTLKHFEPLAENEPTSMGTFKGQRTADSSGRIKGLLGKGIKPLSPLKNGPHMAILATMPGK